VVHDEQTALSIRSKTPRLVKMCVRAQPIVRALRESDSADGGHDPVRADGSYFANGVVKLVAHIKIPVFVQGDSRRGIKLRLGVRAIGTSCISIAGKCADDPVCADGLNLADCVISEIALVK